MMAVYGDSSAMPRVGAGEERVNLARSIEIHVERLPEGVYLATSADVPGLTVEADSREEAMRLAPQVALDLIEEECGAPLPEPPRFSFQFG